MGDMADYAMDHGFDLDGCGYDGWDSWQDDGYGNEICRTKSTLSCRYCHSTSVYWSNTEKGWRLFETETHEIHNCPKFGTETTGK